MAAKLPQSESLREVCKAMTIQGFTSAQICSKTGVNPKTLQTWRNRFKWQQAKQEAIKAVATLLAADTQKALTAADSEISNIGNSLRLNMARKLESQVTQIDKVRLLQNTPMMGQGQAAVTKTIAETAALVFGWRDEQPEIAVHFHSLGARPAAKADIIDVASTPQEPEQSKADSGQ